MKFSEFYLCFHNSCEIWHSFPRAPVRKFLWCYYRWLIVLITSLALEKCKKNAICFKLFSHKVFCPLKFKITRSPLYSVNPYLMFNECLEMKNCSFLNPWFLVRKSLCFKSNIKHSTQCFTARWNTSKFVKNTLLHVVFSTLFSVFHLVIKHFVSCLIYYLKSPKKGGGGGGK